MSVKEPLQPNCNFAWVKADNTRLTKEELHNQRRQDMNEKPEALRLADELEVISVWNGGGVKNRKAAAELRRLYAENERLREENRLWYSRAVALFWKCDTDNITVGRLQSAAKEIDAALRQEETT